MRTSLQFSTRGLLAGLCCACCVLGARAGAAAAQEQTPVQSRLGAVGGTVVETDGTPVPGATVKLVGPSPRQTQYHTVADGDGRFEFVELRHGDYQLLVELPGLQAPGAVGVVVLPGQRVDTSVVLSLFAYEVDLSVVARSEDIPQVIDTDSTADRRELTNREITRMPTRAEQVLDALPVFPGVVRGPHGLISIGGTLPTDSVYLFNGADLMDPFTGQYRLQLPLDAVESMSLESGVSSADYGDRLGGVVNVTSATAGSTWTTELASPLPKPWIEGGSLRGVRRFTPRFRISGPLSPNLTMSQSFQYRYEREDVFDVPDGRGDHTIENLWQSLTQFDWRIDDNNDLRFMLLGAPDQQSFADLSGVIPIEASTNVDHGTVALIANYQHRFDERSFFDTVLQFNRQNADVLPNNFQQTGLDMLPENRDGAAFNEQHRRSLHWQLKTTYNRILGPDEGRHLFKAGFEVNFMDLKGTYANDSIRVFDGQGRIRRLIESVGVTKETIDQTGDKWEAAVFVQERWRPSDRLWFDIGLRASHDSAVRSVRLAPRFGAAWDITGDGRTLLKGSFGIMNRRVYLAEQFWNLFPTRVETRYDEEGNGERLYLPSRRAEDLESPRATVWSVSATRRIGPRITAHVAYTERRSRNQLVFDRIEHTPVPIVPGIEVGFEIPDDVGIVLTNAGRSTVKQLEVTANIRVGQQDQLFVSYVRSSSVGDLNDFSHVASDLPSPILRHNFSAISPYEVPDRLVLWGTFHLPWDLIVSPALEWRTGLPWSSLDVYRDYAGDPHDRRFPDYISPDILITKGVRVMGVPLRVGVMASNFIFRDNPRDVIATVDSPRYGEFLNKIPSRIRLRLQAAF